MSWVCDRCGASVREDLGACPMCSPSRSASEEAREAAFGNGEAPREAHMSSGSKALPKATAPQRKYQYNDKDFNHFYALWPRKRSKEAALRAWEAALRNGASAEEVIEGAAREASRVKRLGVELRHVPYPATWLNAAGWLDEDDAPPEVGDLDPATVVGTPEFEAARFGDAPFADEELRALINGIGSEE